MYQHYIISSHHDELNVIITLSVIHNYNYYHYYYYYYYLFIIIIIIIIIMKSSIDIL
jgi:hypothetical protein